jgi:hypothetical protein
VAVPVDAVVGVAEVVATFATPVAAVVATSGSRDTNRNCTDYTLLRENSSLKLPQMSNFKQF